MYGLLWISNKEVCRTALATPGLFEIYIDCTIYKSFKDFL